MIISSEHVVFEELLEKYKTMARSNLFRGTWNAWRLCLMSLLKGKVVSTRRMQLHISKPPLKKRPFESQQIQSLWNFWNRVELNACWWLGNTVLCYYLVSLVAEITFIQWNSRLDTVEDIRTECFEVKLILVQTKHYFVAWLACWYTKKPGQV